MRSTWLYSTEAMSLEQHNLTLAVRCALKLAHSGDHASNRPIPRALAFRAVLALFILLFFPPLEFFDARHLIFYLLPEGILLLSHQSHTFLDNLLRPEKVILLVLKLQGGFLFRS